MVAHTGTPIPSIPSDKKPTGNPIGANLFPIFLARTTILSLISPGPGQTEQVTLDVRHQHSCAHSTELSSGELQRFGLVCLVPAGRSAVPVDHGQ